MFGKNKSLVQSKLQIKAGFRENSEFSGTVPGTVAEKY